MLVFRKSRFSGVGGIRSEYICIHVQEHDARICPVLYTCKFNSGSPATVTATDYLPVQLPGRVMRPRTASALLTIDS